MYFSPKKVSKVWSRSQSLLKLLLWIKGVEWVKVLDALGPLCLWQCINTNPETKFFRYCYWNTLWDKIFSKCYLYLFGKRTSRAIDCALTFSGKASLTTSTENRLWKASLEIQTNPSSAAQLGPASTPTPPSAAPNQDGAAGRRRPRRRRGPASALRSQARAGSPGHSGCPKTRHLSDSGHPSPGTGLPQMCTVQLQIHRFRLVTV